MSTVLIFFTLCIIFKVGLCNRLGLLVCSLSQVSNLQFDHFQDDHISICYPSGHPQAYSKKCSVLVPRLCLLSFIDSLGQDSVC